MTSPTDAPAVEAPWSVDWVERFVRCPDCHGDDLGRDASAITCRGCGWRLPIDSLGILGELPPGGPAPRVVEGAPSDRFAAITARVRRFYEEHPFPNYDGFESVGDLLGRASRSVYAAALDRQIPVGASVLEVGCGTGQLGAFLSIGGRAVVGADMARASLALAARFRARHGLRNLNLLHASLFDLPLRPGCFDLVLCKGVLHHTPDPRRGFSEICRLVRPGGYIVLGLYNRIGRLPTSWRRLAFRLRLRGTRSGDLVMREIARSDAKRLSWFLDQYANPHESRHTVDEVLRWFAEEGVCFTNAVPSLRLFEPFDPGQPLFAPRSPGGRLEHWLVQLSWIATISREGALFDLIGRKGEAA